MIYSSCLPGGSRTDLHDLVAAHVSWVSSVLDSSVRKYKERLLGALSSNVCYIEGRRYGITAGCDIDDVDHPDDLSVDTIYLSEMLHGCDVGAPPISVGPGPGRAARRSMFFFPT